MHVANHDPARRQATARSDDLATGERIKSCRSLPTGRNRGKRTDTIQGQHYHCAPPQPVRQRPPYQGGNGKRRQIERQTLGQQGTTHPDLRLDGRKRWQIGIDGEWTDHRQQRNNQGQVFRRGLAVGYGYFAFPISVTRRGTSISDSVMGNSSVDRPGWHLTCGSSDLIPRILQFKNRCHSGAYALGHKGRYPGKLHQ